MSEPRPGVPSTEHPGDPQKGAAAFFLVTQLPAAVGTPAEDLVDVWTHEWDDEDERWGVALNGTGQDRLWYGSLYLLGDDQTMSVRHPAGSAVVTIGQQAIGVLKPDHNEWLCPEPDAIPNWEQATLFAIHDHLNELGHDVPKMEELLEVSPDA
ncbi:hypothetical protein SAMN06269185_3317 [Natronoarchaeum philippinense]|uniref:Uncharacterized protein n=1 Tax=Natronoarchaeum philippinense TaxID=558529 RepID=A0A285PDP5_NATPI|nr:hypothetical protein [Natronoarchaeum philippinense]SNZ18276.1 hypothetical protein SAMN06269185_3317 [Natronoarchaeum philippinense]